MNRKKVIISLLFNITILCLTIIGLGIGVLDAQRWNESYVLVFKYFTVLSNIFLAISCGVLIVYEGKWLAHKIYDLPKEPYILKLCATVSTTITFLVVIFFLSPQFALGLSPGDYTLAFLYSGSNAIFHVVSPVLGILAFILFENRNDIKLPQTLFALIFVALYSIFYTLDIFYKFMPEDGIVSHDWYNFTGNGTRFIPLVLFIFIVVTVALSGLLWLANRKIRILEKKTANK